MILRFTLFLLLFTAAIYPAFSQSNYNKGHVIKSKGDTLKGYIDYREWGKTPAIINFKNDLNSEKVEFTAATAKAIEITGIENYISFSGAISMDKSTFPDLPSQLTTTTANKTVFLKEEFTGQYVSLFIYTDSVKTRFFITEKDAQPEELLFHQYYRSSNQTITVDIYKNRLLQLAAKYIPENQSLPSSITRSTYSKSDIAGIIKKINQNHITIADKGSRDKQAVGRFFAGIGINSNTTKVTGVTFFNGVSSPAEYQPKFNIGYDLFLLPHTRRLILRGEVSASFNSPTLSKSESKLFITNAIFSFKQTNISFIPQFIYNVYNASNFKAFIGGGVAISALINSNSTVTEYFGTTPTQLTPYKLRSSQQAYMAEAGVTVGKCIELNLAYFTRLNSSDESFTISTQTLGFGVKYLFGQ